VPEAADDDAVLALGSGAGLDISYDPPVVAISRDGAWLVYVGLTTADRMLYLRNTSTGEVRPLAGTNGATHPFFSPDGQNVLAETWASIGGDFGDIIRVNLRTKATKVIVRSGYAAHYVSSGYVLFGRGGNLMAVRYDIDRNETMGDPVTLAAGAGMESLFGCCTRHLLHRCRRLCLRGRSLSRKARLDRPPWQRFTAFSPDGRSLAFQSTQTGSAELFIRSYPDGKVIGQVSTGAGWEPRWTPKGDLFYRTGRRWFSTHASSNAEPRWDPPRLAFQTDFTDTPGWSYDVSSDAQRLLVVKRTHAVPTTRINLVLNWFAELNQPASSK
jgi:WD40-like Beta Propeller Repeat